MSDRIKSIGLKALKIIGWLAASLLTILIIIILAIRTPYVQNKLTQRAIVYLQDKIGTKVNLDGIYIGFPKKIVIEGLYAEDQKSDTLLYVGTLSIDTDLWGLTQSRIELNSIRLSNAIANLQRKKNDSSFNFDYIIKAFSSEGDASDTTSSEWTFALNKVKLDQVAVLFNDQEEGNFVKTRIGQLDLSLNGSDMAHAVYKISDFELENTTAQISLSQNASAEADQNQSDSIPFDLDVENIHLKNIDIKYEQPDASQLLQVTLADLVVEANKIDLKNRFLDLNRIALDHSTISYQDGSAVNAAEMELPVVADSTVKFSFPVISWIIKLKELSLTDNTLEYNNAHAPTPSFDQNHIRIASLNFIANDIEVTESNYAIDLKKLSFMEKSGVEIKSFTSFISFSDSQLTLKGFDFNAGNSRVIMDANASYDLTQGKFIDYERVNVDVEVKDSFIAPNDLLFFLPTLLDSLPVKIPTTSLFLNTHVHGVVSDLIVEQFMARVLDSTSINLEGRIKGLPDFNTSLMEIRMHSFTTTRADVMQILYDSMVPTSIQIPEWIHARGNFAGELKASTVSAHLESNLGQIETKGKYDFKSIETYDFAVTTKDFNVGKLLMQPTMDTLTMSLQVNGSGLAVETLDAQVAAKVEKFKYNDYTYSDFELKGSFKEFLFSGSAALHDKNLDFTLAADLDYSAETTHYKATFNLNNADFRALKISQRPLKARATLYVDLNLEELGKINGDIGIRKVAIFNGESLYKIDSLMVASINNEAESSITLRSDIIEGDFKGTFSVLDLPKTIRQHLNQYFSMHDSTLHAFEKPQNFKFNLTLKNSDLLTDIIFPELKSFVPGKIEGEFDSEKNLLTMNVGVTKVRYASSALDSLLFTLNSDKDAFNYKMRVKNLRIDTLHVSAVQIQGTLANNQHETELIIVDSFAKEKYRLAGSINSIETGFKFSLLNERLLINYEKWQVPADNSLTLKNKRVIANNFNLTKGNEKLEIITSENDSTLTFQFNQLQLSNLTSLVEGILPAGGVLNGNLKLGGSTDGEFNSNLTISELSLFERKWGNATISVAHALDKYTMDVNVEGENVKLQSTGHYQSNAANHELVVNLNLAALNLEVLEPLSFGQLKDVKGNGEGSLAVKSQGADFSIGGELMFTNATFTSTYLKNAFSLKKERIAFNKEGIVLDNFMIKDVNNNEATVKGIIRTERYSHFAFDLRASMKKFQVLNTKEGDNDLYYGLVKVDAEAKITGASEEPTVELTIALNDESDFTYIVPESQKDAQELKGVVKFVDYDAALDPFLANLLEDDTTQTLFKGLNLTANLELGDKALLNIVLDPRTGDKLSINGNASLVLGMDASGAMDLSGRYEIKKGTYNFSFQNLAKREFNLVSGSAIEWSGDPLNATLDITARYQLDASPLDLVYNQINTSNQSQINNYNQRLPFIVLLIIKGQLLQPLITFKLDMPEEKRDATIYAKLQDINTRESDLNKQVFSLIILKRFISDNPLESQSASSINNTARQSVSRILSDQLNRLSDNIKGVELTFDIKSYENFSGDEVQGETKAQLGISKSLLDERLVIKLAGNVDLEGGDGTKREASDYIGDIALEYKLTPDGRFRIVGFRNSNFDRIDGELIETGTGLIYIRDYNTLRELFKSDKKKK
jgi:hypothetical protein